MPVLHETITVPRSPQEVFTYLADFSSAAEWDPGVASATKLGDGPPAVGDRFELSVRFGPTTSDMTYTLEALEPSSRIVLRGTGARVSALDEILIQPNGEGSRVTYIADIRLKGLMRIAEPFLGGVFDKIGKKAVQGLERTLSGQSG